VYYQNKTKLTKKVIKNRIHCKVLQGSNLLLSDYAHTVRWHR